MRPVSGVGAKGMIPNGPGCYGPHRCVPRPRGPGGPAGTYPSVISVINDPCRPESISQKPPVSRACETLLYMLQMAVRKGRIVTSLGGL